MFQEDKQHKLFPNQWAISQTHHSTNKPPQLLPVSPSAGRNPELEKQLIESFHWRAFEKTNFHLEIVFYLFHAYPYFLEFDPQFECPTLFRQVRSNQR